MVTYYNAGATLTMRMNFELKSMKNIVQVGWADGEFAGELLTPVH